MLVGGQVDTVWRVAMTSYGPLNPPVRSDYGRNDRGGWSRWDVAGHRTIYAATCRVGALAEAIAPLRVAINLPLTDLFTDDEPFDADDDWFDDLPDTVSKEWRDERHYMGVGQIAASWRISRGLYELRLPRNGWFVDIADSASVHVLEDSADQWMPAKRYGKPLTLSQLTGSDRMLTTSAAEWVWKQVLDDKSLPHGIYYPSKYGTDWGCLAIWLRAVDSGRSAKAEPTRQVRTHVIETADRDVIRMADRFNLRLH
ncbi:MAG TPA: RES domain-containing protein [Mycobacterium sp.]|nr:RES domain-containing protein [Mycobacterium sp.]